MLHRIDFRQELPSDLRQALPRGEVNIEKALDAVEPIISRVRREGSKALYSYAHEFDGCLPESLRVPSQAIKKALDELPADLRSALEMSIEHNRKGHSIQVPEEAEIEIISGGIVRQRWIPVSRVGLYVPGGLAVYPSSVIMNVCAAQVAGVEKIALASPPQKTYGSLPHPTILAACALLGVDEVYAVGGAQAIAMFAYGVNDEDLRCDPVDVITGPGNIYVAAAKRAVRGVVGIDAEAGPTEIAIIADSSANPTYVAADMISQAEHDPQAASVCITDSVDLADAVDSLLEEMIVKTKHTERIRTALSGKQSYIVLVKNIPDAIDVANAYGAEHLEIHTRKAREDARHIRNAGAIFVGPYNPVPLGDYIAGSNHVLPTSGTARFASGLNVHSFIKSVQEIEYSYEAMSQMCEPLNVLAEDEDLPAHGQSLQVRVNHSY
ncbi:MAG: histidinol dehydrogenase [Actinomycetaceae bacterium]|nr:histidinol dehydrogenase [Actinomycetaceae bacterium]